MPVISSVRARAKFTTPYLPIGEKPYPPASTGVWRMTGSWMPPITNHPENTRPKKPRRTETGLRPIKTMALTERMTFSFLLGSATLVPKKNSLIRRFNHDFGISFRLIGCWFWRSQFVSSPSRKKSRAARPFAATVHQKQTLSRSQRRS